MIPAVEIVEYSYSYPDGTPALNQITLRIPHGQKVALVGPNGAGKSTLLLAMAGFIHGTGQVRIDGMETNAATIRKIRSILGCCMENPDDQLFMPTLYEDVAFGPMNLNLEPSQVKARVQEALCQVDLLDMAHKPPHHLSAGQKRAASIATVLAMSPRIITFDEPDGSLDPRHRKKIEAILKTLPQTLVVATCNMRFAAAVADRVVIVDHGRIVADGTTGDILTNEQLMADHGLETP